jgi:hypothetical protein
MTNKEKFHHTVNILVQAFLNDELAHKTCSACAVGNIVAAATGTKPKRNDELAPIEFDNTFFADGSFAMNGWYATISGTKSIEGECQIRATGYTVDELKEIEYVFEHAPGDPGKPDEGLFRGRCTDPTWMFNGLMAVVDVLAEIHGIDLSTATEAKQLFVK